MAIGIARVRAIVCACAIVAISARANGQAAPIDAAVRREVIDTVAAQIERIYVDADTGLMIAARLRDRLRAGGYDTIADPARLAQALTTDLRSVNHDLHLSVAYAAGGGGRGGGGGGPLGFLSQSQHFALGRRAT